MLEFLDLPESPRLVESELESALISRLQDFLLEPGIWLCFHRQADPINTGRRSFLSGPDLLSRPAQMLCCNRSQGRQTDPRGPRADADVCELPLTWEILSADDNPTVGLILCAEKNDAVVRYVLGDENQQIYASRYRLQLPSEEDLRLELQRERRLIQECTSKEEDEDI